MKKLLSFVISLIISVGCLTACGNSRSSTDSSKAGNSSSAETTTTTTKAETTTTKATKKYEITGGELGDYGKSIVLNQNTDSPVTKYLYKLPAGKYKVVTTTEKVAAFSIVKDQIGIESGNEQYPETLQYSGEMAQYRLTAGDDNFNGTVKKEYSITVSADESIEIAENDSLIFEEL